MVKHVVKHVIELSIDFEAEKERTMNQDHQRIATLQDRTYVEGVYSIVNPQLAQTRTNKPYLKCMVRDASGEITARAWSFEEAQFDAIANAGFVFLRGSTQAYQGQLQLIIEQIEPREVSIEEMRALLPSTTKDVDAMFARVCDLLRSMTLNSDSSRDPSSTKSVTAHNSTYAHPLTANSRKAVPPTSLNVNSAERQPEQLPSSPPHSSALPSSLTASST